MSAGNRPGLKATMFIAAARTLWWYSELPRRFKSRTVRIGPLRLNLTLRRAIPFEAVQLKSRAFVLMERGLRLRGIAP